MKTFFPILVFISLIISSCNPYRYIDIQVVNSSQVKLPKGVFTLLVVDPNKTGFIRKDSASSLYSKLAISCFNQEFKNKLHQSPIFQDTNIKMVDAPSFIFSSDSMRKENYMDSLRSIYSKEKENILMVRYGFKIIFSKGQINTWYKYEYTDFNFKFQFVLSNLITKEVCDFYQTSLFDNWINESKIDSSSKVVTRAFKSVAESYAHRVAPYWSTEERQLLFSQNKLMRKAYASFCKNDLDKALETWKHLYEIGTRKLSARAAINIALVYEIKDDLDACESWLIKSNLKKLNPFTRTYLDMIRKRKLDRITIDNQF